MQLENMPEARTAILLNSHGQKVEQYGLYGTSAFSLSEGNKAAGVYWLLVYDEYGKVVGQEKVLIGR